MIKIIMVGGRRRTGTNYVGYFFALHPDVLYLHGPLLDFKGTTYNEFYHHVRGESSQTPQDVNGKPFLEKFIEDKNAKEKSGHVFDYLVLKRDFGETMHHTLERVTDAEVLFVCCTRNLYDTFKSERTCFVPNTNYAITDGVWSTATGKVDMGSHITEYVDSLEKSINCIDKIIANAKLIFYPINVFRSHNETKHQLMEVLQIAGIAASKEQKYFLEERRKIAWSKLKMSAEMYGYMTGLLNATPGFKELNDRYNQIFESVLDRP